MRETTPETQPLEDICGDLGREMGRGRGRKQAEMLTRGRLERAFAFDLGTRFDLAAALRGSPDGGYLDFAAEANSISLVVFVVEPALTLAWVCAKQIGLC